MLPPYIIERIRQRERRPREQPRLELPLPPLAVPVRAEDEGESTERGVVVIDLWD